MDHKTVRRRVVGPLVIGGVLLAVGSDGSDASTETTVDQAAPEHTLSGDQVSVTDADNEPEEITPLVANVLADAPSGARR